MRFTIQILVVFLCSIHTVASQESSILWQKTVGGSGEDNVDALQTDEQGDSYVVTTVQIGDNHDIQISKITGDGFFVWTTTIGGDRDETGADILLDASGNLIVLGSTYSEKINTLSTKGYSDIFFAKLSTDGTLIDLKTFGGSGFEFPASVLQKPNGNFLITASSSSSDGDVPENLGQLDIWVFEVNEALDITRSQIYGGSDDDVAVKSALLDNGNIVTVASSATYEAGFNANNGDLDILLLQTTNEGTLLWLELFGGFQADYAYDLEVMDNGNFLIAGSTFSNDGDVLYNHGGSDAWLLEVSSTGELEWSETYGSYGNESIVKVEKSTDGFVLLGTSNSSSLNSIENHGGNDFWLYTINENKEVTDQYLFGASGFDEGVTIALNNDGSILMGGRTNSSDGVVQGNKGKNDGWLLKINRNESNVFDKANIHPNPTKGTVYINNLDENPVISVYNMNGVEIQEKLTVSVPSKILDLSAYPSGMYTIHISYSNRKEVHRIVKH